MKTYIVDSFTDRPFAGNPAGVCLVEKSDVDGQKMLLIAQELGLSETAFVLRPDDQGTFPIRFFSPVMEIPLCGHATLASARVLFDGEVRREVHFRNIDDLKLSATSASNGNIILRFPVYETEPAKAPSALLSALGLSAVRNVAYNAETRILLLEITDPVELAALDPDFAALRRSHDSINGVLVTAPAGDDGYDFHSRYFWPWSGTNEDPVTGGTHTFLTKYWATRLGKTKLRSFQSSKRTGFMEAELAGDQVLLKSKAHIVLRGEIGV